MKPEPDKEVLTAFLQLLLRWLWCAQLGGNLERCQMRARGTQSWQDHLNTGGKAEDLNYTYHGSSCQILQRKLANHRSAVTAVAHERAITRYKS